MDEELQAAARSLIPPRDHDRSGESSPDSYREPEAARGPRQREADGHRDRKRQRHTSSSVFTYL